MYALVILLVFVGYLAIMRVLDRPSWGRLLCSRLVTAAAALHALLGVRAARRRRAWLLVARGAATPTTSAVRHALAIGALVVGALTFIPWLPTFRVPGPAHRHAVGRAREPGREHRRGGEDVRRQHPRRRAGRCCSWSCSAVFARGIDRRHLERRPLDPARAVRIEVAIGFLTLGARPARSPGSTGTTFEGRYAAVMFPLFLLAAAFGITVFTSRALRYAVIALLLVGGFWGGTSNALRSRTQAFQIAQRDRGPRPARRPRRVLPGLGRHRRRPASCAPSPTRSACPGSRRPDASTGSTTRHRVDAMRPLDIAAGPRPPRR